MGCSNSKKSKTKGDALDLHKNSSAGGGGSGSSHDARSPPNTPKRSKAPKTSSMKQKAKAMEQKDEVKNRNEVTVESPETGPSFSIRGAPSWVRPLHAVEISRANDGHESPSMPALQAVEVHETRVIHPPPSTRVRASGAEHYAVRTRSDMHVLSSPMVASLASSELDLYLLHPSARPHRGSAADVALFQERPLPILRPSSHLPRSLITDRLGKRQHLSELEDTLTTQNSREKTTAFLSGVSASSTASTPTQSTTSTSLVEKRHSLYEPRDMAPMCAATLPPMTSSSHSPKSEKPTESGVEPLWGTNSKGWEVLEQIRLLLHVRNSRVT
ncbi:hypothetical protein TraAM80_06453 [Trypanosoma rangeli]|uniref:Uncharacterized protein n=1 Tax=Trypanosoma rangeli TaxID=5698 RepID=A0A3R7K9W0_TRYRA|nr:uncharacterized protein TraAM80_06453 [Trypanosoma rangeli]RNF02317.1 hypothetical protein TraAM80_06453 [Trypanosoma rangeli]|eukprot:RNF02317.1 hypothetical protein TraAM80_06453 [Trypanosoma rangeli]